VRVCAFATWPGQIKPGTVVEAPLHMVDWYPTLLTLAGASLEQPLELDGRDMWATLTAGAPSPHSEILLNASPRHGAIRAGDWKLVLNGDLNTGDGEEPRPPRPSVTLPGARRVELFNLAADPGEKQNLAAAKPEVVKDLAARYDALARQAVAPKSRPKPAGFRSPKVWGQAEK
jgi:arylsulfatase A-like enzyme